MERNIPEKPLVSVVISTYNRGKDILKAVGSAMDQTFRDLEIVIIDDCSADGTAGILKKMAQENSRIRVISNKVNLGNAESLNRGIREAKGKYIARLDDDDRWADFQKIEKQVRFLENNPEYVLTGGGMIIIGRDKEEKLLLPEKDEEIRNLMLVKNLFVHSAVMFRKSAFEKAGGYDKEFDGMEDKELWLRMGKLGKLLNFQTVFVYYSGHWQDNPGYASKKYSRFKRFAMDLKIIKKYKDAYSGAEKAIAYSLARLVRSFFNNK